MRVVGPPLFRCPLLTFYGVSWEVNGGCSWQHCNPPLLVQHCWTPNTGPGSLGGLCWGNPEESEEAESTSQAYEHCWGNILKETKPPFIAPEHRNGSRWGLLVQPVSFPQKGLCSSKPTWNRFSTPPDRDRRCDSPAWSGRGSRHSRRTSG